MIELEGRTTRRGFARLLGAGAAIATLRPWAAGAQTPATAPAPAGGAPASASGAAIRLSANENPYGPPPVALAAIQAASAEACRYPDEAEGELRAALAKALGVGKDRILLGAGSSQILRDVAAAYCGRGAKVVTADPTFEALGRYSAIEGADLARIRLTADGRHDLEAMLAAAGGSGVVYVCNPNNPTATLTPSEQMRAFLERVPASVIVVVDEAYHHYAEGALGYETVLPLLERHPNLIVARTFSKIYGMAGLRCGFAVAAPAVIAKLAEHQSWDSSNVMALVAARAALGEAAAAHLDRSRALNARLRSWTCDGVARAGGKVLPSAANFFMADLGRDVGPVIQALHARGVDVGRRFPAMPEHLRVTVGTESEMHAFLAAFEQVMTSKPAAS